MKFCDLYSRQPLSKMRGFQPKHFSFNVDGEDMMRKGEGEHCRNAISCRCTPHLEVCHGKRFKEEVLEVTYREKNIFDILEMSVDEAFSSCRRKGYCEQGQMPF
jgi:excinuclease ABC subunit A